MLRLQIVQVFVNFNRRNTDILYCRPIIYYTHAILTFSNVVIGNTCVVDEPL